MTESQARLLAAARSFAGVKWRHQGRNRNSVDCGGLVWCMYAECGVQMPDLKRYGRNPFAHGLDEVLVEGLGQPVWSGRRGACRAALLQYADVVVMTSTRLPRHLAIIGDHPVHGLSMIDADGLRGFVQEQGMHADLIASIVAIYRKPIE